MAEQTEIQKLEERITKMECEISTLFEINRHMKSGFYKAIGKEVTFEEFKKMILDAVAPFWMSEKELRENGMLD